MANRAAYTTVPTEVNFGEVRSGVKKEIDISLRNNYIYPKTRDYTVASPFTIDGGVSATITNPYSWEVENVDDLLDLHMDASGNIVMLFNHDGKLYIQVKGESAIEVDWSTYTGGVIRRIAKVSGINFYVGFVYSGTSIYPIFYNSSVTSIGAAISVSEGTITSINEFVGSELIVTTNDVESDTFGGTLIAGLRVNASNVVLLISDGTTSLGYFLKDYGEALLAVEIRSLFNGEYITKIDGTKGLSLNLLDKNGKVYTITGSKYINTDLYRLATYNGAYPELTGTGYIDANDQIIGQLYTNVSGTDQSVNRRKYDYDKALGASSGDIIFEISDSWTSSSSVSDVLREITSINVECDLLSDLTIEFGEMITNSSTFTLASVSNSTITLTNGGTVGDYVENDSDHTSIDIATHIRIREASADKFLFGGLTITDNSTGIVLFSLNGFEYNSEISDLDDNRVRPVDGYQFFDITADENTIKTDELCSLRVFRDNLITFRNDNTDEIGIWYDSIYRTNLFDASNTKTGSYYLFLYDSEVHAFAYSNISEVILTTLDSNLDRTDDSVSATGAITSSTLGYATDNLDYSTFTTAFLVMILKTLTLPTAPYGLVMFGHGHVDFKRINATTKFIKSYFYSPAGITYIDIDESIPIISNSINPVIEHFDPVSIQDEGDIFESFIETVNVYYDPTYQSMMVNDSTVLAMVSTAVSKHPSILDWTADGNYEMNDNEGFYRNGDVLETSDMTNGSTPLLISGTKQIVVNEIVVADRSANSVRVRVAVSKSDNQAGEAENLIYDDFKLFYIQIMPAGLIGVIGDGNNA